MDTALPQKFPFILDRKLAKANCTENHVCTSCDTVVLGMYLRQWETIFIIAPIFVILQGCFLSDGLQTNWSSGWAHEFLCTLPGEKKRHRAHNCEEIAEFWVSVHLSEVLTRFPPHHAQEELLGVALQLRVRGPPHQPPGGPGAGVRTGGGRGAVGVDGSGRPASDTTVGPTAGPGPEERGEHFPTEDVNPLLHTGHYCVRMTKILILK